MSRALLAAAFYILLFSNSEGAFASQLGALTLLGLSALSSNKKIVWYPPCLFEVALIMLPFWSLVSNSIVQENYIFGYTIAFLVTIMSVYIVVRALTLSEILSVSAIAYIAMAFTAISTNLEAFSSALDPSNPNHWALRFRPYGMHPNLLGFIFGAGCLILLHQAVVSSGRKRAFYIISAGFCVAIIVAAAARASLLALAFSVAFVTLLFLNRLGPKIQRSLLYISIGGILVCLVFGNSLYFFLSQQFELESSTRGFDSGGSGRVELWQQGFDFIFNRDLLYALIGGGLRSAESIGFSTESSYITILLESGILFGGFLIASIIASVVASIRSARQAFPLNWEEIFSICIVLYVMFESIFNRYMIAIGNNLSLVLLMIIAKLSIIAESRRSAIINLTNPLNAEN